MSGEKRETTRKSLYNLYIHRSSLPCYVYSMESFFSTKKLDRYHAYAPSKEFLDELVETYDLHEIIEEDILESTVQDKIDVYDNCLFLVLHFPKYKADRNKYITNEFNIII